MSRKGGRDAQSGFAPGFREGRSAGRRLLGSGSIRPLPDIPCSTPWQERPPAETEGGRMAMEKSIYQEIAARTGGDIYVGVVGPVRTGKSTLIKRVMEELVIPNISDPYRKERARDELPQSGSGKTIMT